MVIVHVIADLSTGGAEMMLKRLIEAHRCNPEFEHQVISLHGLGRVGPELRSIGVPVTALGMRGVRDIPRVVNQLVRCFRQIRPDIVHSWMYHANLLAGLAGRIAECRWIVWGIRATSFDATMGVSHSTTFLRRISGRLFGSIPAAIVYVADAARKAHEGIGYPKNKSVVIPNGYVVPKLGQREDSRTRLGIPSDVVVVGSVGRFNAAKDPQTFVRAAALTLKKHPSVRFLMVGSGISGDNAELSGWISSLSLEDRFILAGEYKQVEECLVAMDIFCLHSVTEGFPNVVAEAMSAGLPIVATDVGDTAYLVGDTGIIVPPRNPDAIAAALGELIGRGSTARQELGNRGQQRIAESFSLSSIVGRYEALYRSLCEATPVSIDVAEAQG